MAQRKTILVTGATGQQGGAVARRLLEKGQHVRCMTRSPDRARLLSSLGAEVVRGDFEDRESLNEAVKDCDGVFIMGTFFEKGARAETAHGEAVVLACWNAGVPHVCYSSVIGADRGTGIPHFESKARVEGYLRETGQPCTILRPGFFMENFESPWMLPGIENGVVSTPLLPDRRIPMVCLSDIGEFASEAFLRPRDFVGKTIDLAGDELSMAEAVLMVSCAANRLIRYEWIPAERAEEAVGHDLALMYRWFNDPGHHVEVEGLQKTYGIRLTPFNRYLGRSRLYRKAA